jgi:hypothetical protein
LAESWIVRSRLQRRLVGVALGAAVGIGVVLAIKREEKASPAVQLRTALGKDGYWLPLFIQCAPAEACETTRAP